MRLPNRAGAVVPESKVTGYLLSLTHADGRAKAIFFEQFGFSAADWKQFAAALKDHALQYPVVDVEESPFGKRYVIEGRLVTPDGRRPLIRSVWFIEHREEIPRLVTAYPLRRKT